MGVRMKVNDFNNHALIWINENIFMNHSEAGILWHENTFQVNKGRNSKQLVASVSQGNYKFVTMEAARLKRSLIS